LCEHGFAISFAPGQCRYDLLAERDGKIYRVQVKSTSVIRGGGYMFWAVKGNRYKKADFDLIACIALDISVIAFLPSLRFQNKCKIYLRPPESKRKSRRPSISEYPLGKALKEIG
jgi:hypothetical protein